jgi:hypothetical protein
MSTLSHERKMEIRGKLALATALLRKAEVDADADNFDSALHYITQSMKELTPIQGAAEQAAIMDEYEEDP